MLNHKVSDIQHVLDYDTGVLDFRIAWWAANGGGGENYMLQADAASHQGGG